jgi:hypothetical protein
VSTSPPAAATASEIQVTSRAPARFFAPTCQPTRAMVPTSKAPNTLHSDHSSSPATCIAASDVSAW